MYESIDIVRRVIPSTETHFQIVPTPFLVNLMHFDGVDAATSFPDATGRHPVYAHGNVQIDTAQSVFGGASCLFDGTGDYLTMDGSGDFKFGTGDFTVDFRFQLNAIGLFQTLWDGGRGDVLAGFDFPSIFVQTDNVLRYDVGVTDQITATTVLAAGAWHHVAVTRSGTNTRLFLDGTQEGATYVAADNLTIDPNGPTIGSRVDGFRFLNGWIDELRVLKGQAAWTANFTPPASPYTVI